MKTFITLNTSTSYVECNSIPLIELVELYDNVYEWVKKMNETS